MSHSRFHDAIRPLLAVLAIAAASPTYAATVVFSGTEMNDTPPPAPSASCAAGQVYIAFSPSTAITAGTSNFGGFAPTMAHCLTPPPTTYSGGVFEFAFDAGDLLTGTYSGFITPTAVANVLNTTVDYIVTGGTGRFLGASGAFQGVGILDRNPLRPVNNLVLNGVLDLPAVPEPATWAMMLVGLFGLGASLRAKRRQAIAA
ncbi:MAG: hypothetical protein JWO33_2348 [Caulobacteraceae bacterium]|nr:hypothetical protein [Caulobacteraceae bacterium]